MELQLGVSIHGKTALSPSLLDNTLGQGGGGDWQRVAQELQHCLLGDHRSLWGL